MRITILVMTTIGAGFESVMIDGSMNDLNANIRLTGKEVLKAHELGICVEGELGHVGTAADGDNANEDLYTSHF